MLIQFTFFGAYAIMSIPASLVIDRIGYQKGIVLGLSVAGLGAFLFYPASIVISYGLFLFAFFTLATGITILQVAANPYVAILGKPETASSRLTLTQSFNSLGTTIAPLIGAVLILGGTYYSLGFKKEIILNPTTEQVTGFDGERWQKFSDKADLMDVPVKSMTKDERNHLWFSTELGIYKFDGKDLEKLSISEGVLDANTKGILDNGDARTVKIINEDNFTQFQKEKAKTVQLPYIGLALILLLIAVVFLLIKLPAFATEGTTGHHQGSIFKYPHLVLGAIGIFVYVGAEVSIGSFLVNFLGLSNIAGLVEQDAAKFVALYWGGAMIGRFQGAVAMSDMKDKTRKYALTALFVVGGFLLSLYITASLTRAFLFTGFVVLNTIACILGKNNPNRTLAIFAIATSLLVLTTIISEGHMAMWTIIAVGLFNSIMFPTIFTLAIDGLGEKTSKGSGLLNTAIVGGAIVPLLMGYLADKIGIQVAFTITLVCYAYIAFYAIWGSKLRPKQ
jgi:FHS family L-fucose permease-like MFS transporter